MMGMGGCVFCEILGGSLPASVVMSDAGCTAFMDVRPMNPGHVLVVPDDHIASLVDMPEETGDRLFRTAQRIAAALYNSGLRCDGVNLRLADGEAAGQEVFHVHVHVIPRFEGDGFGLVLDPGSEDGADREELEDTARQITRALESAGEPL